jgi:small-conductance mechanosensitive channel
MKWYNYIAAFFAGVFLANVVPHYVNGVSGNGFPTPFANPPGLGLSSPLINVLWALLNLVIGYFLFKGGKVSGNKWALVLFFIGISLISIQLGMHFEHKFSK